MTFALGASAEGLGYTEERPLIFGIDMDSANKDLFGKPAVEEFSIEDVLRIYGSYSFAPEQWILEDGRQLYLDAAKNIGQNDNVL